LSPTKYKRLELHCGQFVLYPKILDRTSLQAEGVM
jgi:hypothetical protein